MSVSMGVPGTTADRVCLVGDSAGGTLAVATALRTVSYGVRRPDAVLSVYGCMLVKYAPSPSRLLSLMDPLLPLGVLPKCLSGMFRYSLQCIVHCVSKKLPPFCFLE